MANRQKNRDDRSSVPNLRSEGFQRAKSNNHGGHDSRLPSSRQKRSRNSTPEILRQSRLGRLSYMLKPSKLIDRFSKCLTHIWLESGSCKVLSLNLITFRWIQDRFAEVTYLSLREYFFGTHRARNSFFIRFRLRIYDKCFFRYSVIWRNART